MTGFHNVAQRNQGTRVVDDAKTNRVTTAFLRETLASLGISQIARLKFVIRRSAGLMARRFTCTAPGGAAAVALSDEAKLCRRRVRSAKKKDKPQSPLVLTDDCIRKSFGKYRVSYTARLNPSPPLTGYPQRTLLGRCWRECRQCSYRLRCLRTQPASRDRYSR